MSRPTRWVERLLLSGFEPEEAADIRADLRELSRRRGGLRGRAYYWIELLKYPVRRWLEAVRTTKRPDERDEGGMGMESLVRDMRYAVRGLMRNPGFTWMAIAIMTISIGAVAGIFGVVQGVLLDPLPVREPDRLLSVWLEDGDQQRARMTPGNFRDIAELDGPFTHVAAFSSQTTSLGVGDEAVFLNGSRVTPGYFETLGVDPVLGRGFIPREGERGGPSVVILSHHVWMQNFGGDPGITGRAVRLDGTEFDVVGVAPPGVYPTRATVAAEIPFTSSNQDFWVPLRYSPEGWANHRSHVLGMIARLADEVTVPVAEDRLVALGEELRATEQINQGERFLLTDFTEEVVGNVRFGLYMLLGTAGLVLLIAVVNVGALFTLRADDRRPELAIRAAMGAPRGRLLRQMLFESVVISVAASIGAVLVARGALELMQGLVPYQIPRLDDVTIDSAVLAVTAVVGMLVAGIFAVAPAGRLRSGRLTAPGGRATDSVVQKRIQGTVVAVQAGLGVVVLVGATLLARSYGNLRAVDPGFDGIDAWAMSVPAPLETLERIAERIRALPGVAASGVAYDHPLERNWGDGFRIEGHDPAPTDPPTVASLRPFGEGYFDAVGIRLVEGRLPDRVDLAGDVAYAVVNRTLAETHFTEGSAVGRRIILPTAQRMLGEDGVFEIAGVVEDVRFMGPGNPAGAGLYVPLFHFPVGATRLLIRPIRAEAALLPDIRQAVADVDPGIGIQQATRLQNVLDDLLARPRFNMMLLVTLGSIALLLCGLGAYGIMARAVARRVREIGIQMTLGADGPRLARHVMATAMRPMIIGATLGVGTSFAASRLLQSVLFGVSPTDPVSFVAGAGFVLVVGLVAALGPTLRAVSIDPAAALRVE